MDESFNLYKKLQNNLIEHTFRECVDELKNKKLKRNNITSLLSGFESAQKLYDISFNVEYITNQYSRAKKSFRGTNKVSKLSFGLAILYNEVHLYMCKDSQESLEYIKNFKNISPIDFDKYIEDLSKNSNKSSSLNSEIFANAGMNLYGFSFEFNINCFLKALKNMIELPDLIFNLNKNTYKEIDISFYNNDIKNDPKISSLLRTSSYFCIKNNKITNSDSKEFKMFEKSLILGEIKSRFPKKMYSQSKIVNKSKNKNSNTKNQDTLEDIINKLFTKLGSFVDLYKEIDLFDIKDLENIQLIFFYDNSQIKNMNISKIRELIENNASIYKNFKDVYIHLYIVYTLPAISNTIIYDLQNEVQLLKQKEKEREEKEKEREIKEKEREIKDKEREQELRDLRKELENIKLKIYKDKEVLTSNDNDNFKFYGNNDNNSNNFAKLDNSNNAINDKSKNDNESYGGNTINNDAGEGEKSTNLNFIGTSFNYGDDNNPNGDGKNQKQNMP